MSHQNFFMDYNDLTINRLETLGPLRLQTTHNARVTVVTYLLSAHSKESLMLWICSFPAFPSTFQLNLRKYKLTCSSQYFTFFFPLISPNSVYFSLFLHLPSFHVFVSGGCNCANAHQLFFSASAPHRISSQDKILSVKALIYHQTNRAMDPAQP